jgi:hypothetical protein
MKEMIFNDGKIKNLFDTVLHYNSKLILMVTLLLLLILWQCLGIKPRALCMLGKCCTIETDPQPYGNFKTYLNI